MSDKVFAGCAFYLGLPETMLGKTVLVSLTCMNDFGVFFFKQKTADEITV